MNSANKKAVVVSYNSPHTITPCRSALGVQIAIHRADSWIAADIPQFSVADRHAVAHKHFGNNNMTYRHKKNKNICISDIRSKAPAIIGIRQGVRFVPNSFLIPTLIICPDNSKLVKQDVLLGLYW